MSTFIRKSRLHCPVLQAGPLERVHLPEAYSGVHKGYAFCHYTTVVGHWDQDMEHRLHNFQCLDKNTMKLGSLYTLHYMQS